jgi:ABC-type Fe3+-hydroxamate transport system substrate-binding protein
MKNVRLLLTLLILFLSLLSPVSALSAGPPERIISLAPNITEILFAIESGRGEIAHV